MLPTGLTETKWVSAVDVLPGASSMVREVTVSLDKGPVLAAWVPGYEAIAAPSGAAFKLPPAAVLRMQVRYKKHYLDEQNAVKDKSTVGLYFTDAPVSGREIQMLRGRRQSRRRRLHRDADLQRHRQDGGTRPRAPAAPRSDVLDRSTCTPCCPPAAARVPLLMLRAARPEWPRRYWLAEPIELPAGAKIEAVVKPEPANPDDIPTPRRDKLQIALDYVAQ